MVKYKNMGPPLDLVTGPGGLDTTWAQVRGPLAVCLLAVLRPSACMRV